MYHRQKSCTIVRFNLWIALVLSAAASSALKHARTVCFVQPHSFHFVLVYWCGLGLMRRSFSCFNLMQSTGGAGSITTSAHRDNWRKRTASDWAENIGWNRSYTILLYNTSWTIWFTRAKHARGTKAKGQTEFDFLCWRSLDLGKGDNPVSAQRARNGPRGAL